MKYTLHIFACLWFFLLSSSALYAGILDGIDTSNIEDASISISTNPDDTIEEVSRDFGLKVLTVFRLIISGFALIYLVLIGAYMIVYSETEDRIKSQRKQITYSLVGFLFLNIPWMVYTVFFWSDIAGQSNVSTRVIGDAAEVDFWDQTSLTGLNGIVPMFIGFFEIFIFGLAIVLFTWWFFRLILSGGDEEVQKKAKNRILYGILWLIFLGFVKFWGGVVARWDFFGEFATIWNKLVWLALYFAAPVVIFFLVLWAYYYITSAGDEERTKKAKAIFVNTLIATLILLGAYSFLSDLAAFTL